MTRDGYSPTYREPAPPAGLDGVSLTLGEYAEAPSTAGALVFATIIGNSLNHAYDWGDERNQVYHDAAA